MRRRLLDSFDEEDGVAMAQGVIAEPRVREFTEHRRAQQQTRRQLRQRQGPFRKGFGEDLENVTEHTVGLMTVVCRYCQALRFEAEPM